MKTQLHKNKQFFFLLLLFTGYYSQAQDPFRIGFWTTAYNESSTTAILPMEDGSYDVDMNNNGVFSGAEGDLMNQTGTIILDFGAPGNYIVRIRPNASNTSNQLRINYANDPAKEPRKALYLYAWGDIVWTSMEGAFYGTSIRFSSGLTDGIGLGANAPNLTQVTSMANMFNRSEIGDRGESPDKSPKLSHWDVSNVTDMQGMFQGCSLFNSDISTWDVSNVTNMRKMFSNAIIFNQDISGWDVSKVTRMDFLFEEVALFNQDISGWDVSNVVNMESMFIGAAAFNQNIGGWDVSKVTNMASIFYRTASLTTVNYDELLIGWSSLPSLQSGVNFGAPPANYCAGEEALVILAGAPNNWIINNNNGIDSACSNWLGAVNSDWDTAGNWSGGVVPTASSIVVIPEGKVVEKTGSITVESLSILSEGHLTVTANLVSAETVKLYSNATILAKSSTPFDLTYYREIPSSNWHLISSPVLGESVLDLANNNAGLSLGSGSGVSQNIAIGFYDNSEALPDDRWKYYMIGNIDGLNGDDTIDNLNSGAGYAVKLDASGTILFRGTMPTANINRTISLGVGDNYNLLGNPFPSFISSGPVLSANTTLLKSETFWIWDQSTNGYITKLPAITAFNIAPGQAFFVEAKANGNMIFNESAQRRFFSNTFSKSETNRPEIKLNITSGVQEKYAELYYINGTTTGFDNGYDGPMFTGADTSFAIYTHLLSDNQGTAYAIQSLPNSNHDDMIVPVGVNATSGSEVVFSVDVKNFPEGMNVYLEDREKNILTHFNESTVNYTVSLNSDLQGVGRFYLWTTSSSLSASSIILDHVNMYITDNNTLHIIGIQGERTNISIYNILGKNVLSTSFTGKGVNEIKLSNVTTGVYVVQLKTTTGIVNKKIVID